MGFFERALNFNNGGKGFFIGDKASNIIICILALIAVFLSVLHAHAKL